MGITSIPLPVQRKKTPVAKRPKRFRSAAPRLQVPAQKPVSQLPQKATQTCYVYVAGSAGLEDLSQDLAAFSSLPIYKLGITGCGYLDRRLEALGRDRYGSFYFANGELILEQGFDRWSLQEIIAKPGQSPLVEVGARHLAFALPDGMTLDEFDGEFRRAFSDLTLSSVIERLDLRPEEAERFNRFTAYSMGAGSSLSPAIELTCLKTRLEGDEIVARVAALLTRLHTTARERKTPRPQAALSMMSEKVEIVAPTGTDSNLATPSLAALCPATPSTANPCPALSGPAAAQPPIDPPETEGRCSAKAALLPGVFANLWRWFFS